MLVDLWAGDYHDPVLYGVAAADAAVERREAARVVQQFMRCYSATGL